MIQILSRIQSREFINPVTGGQHSIAWFQKIRVVHKGVPGDREHTNEYCWCEPLVTEVRPEDAEAMT